MKFGVPDGADDRTKEKYRRRRKRNKKLSYKSAKQNRETGKYGGRQ